MINERETSTFEEILEQSGILVYKTKGVSMRPLLRENRDVIIIEKKKPSQRCKRLDAVLFKRDNGQYVLHRILKVREKDYWIVGDNCNSGEYIREDQILGVLTTVKRNDKTIHATNPVYRCYVHLWCDAYPIRFFLIRLRWFIKGKFDKVGS